MRHWCKDIPRDEAVRAAEDGRSGPLPTLADVIAEPFADSAKCSPTVSEMGEWLSGMRTERVVPPAPESRPAETRLTSAGMVPGGWWFPPIDKPAPPPPPAPPRVHRGSGVFDANGDEVPWEGVVAALTDERDAAIRERDQGKEFWMGELRLRTAERDTARARVAELESQLESAPAASGAAGTGVVGSEVVGYAVKQGKFYSERLHSNYGDACGVAGKGTVVPLYAAPQPAKGWLTEEERKTLSETADVLDDRKAHAYARFVCDFLARSSPPEVVHPAHRGAPEIRERDSWWRKALAVAGVKVKEVGSE